MTYNCERCGFETDRAQTLKRHLQRQNYCKPLLNDITPQELYDKLFPVLETNYKCGVCDKCFSNRHSKSRHMKTCVETVAALKKENAELKAQLKNRPEPTTAYTHSPSINADTININFNTYVKDPYAFGKENIDYLLDPLTLPQYFKNITNKKMDGLLTLITDIYFNEAHPENHTIYKPTKKDPFVKCFDGAAWNIRTNADTLQRFITSSYGYVDTMCVTIHDPATNEPIPKAFATPFKGFYVRVAGPMNEEDGLTWGELIDVKCTMHPDMVIKKRKTAEAIISQHLYENSKRMSRRGFFKTAQGK